ncbi:hypothetical protein SKAU_G00090410 [Synaphobranchus kaupii]|uniref:Uncharacterized protein n=1 Tax=Synaphobranchus kaupii TaxID=118154 RepID=A0A9Q1FXE2_SYNKA|nr:hypothetical protein SKAU_G00090410 [Synaphobranchus kaupii]
MALWSRVQYPYQLPQNTGGAFSALIFSFSKAVAFGIGRLGPAVENAVPETTVSAPHALVFKLWVGLGCI